MNRFGLKNFKNWRKANLIQLWVLFAFPHGTLSLYFSILPFSCLPKFSKECLFTSCPVLISDMGVWSWEWRWVMRERSQHEGPFGTWNQIILTLVLSCWMPNRKMYLLSLLMQWLLASLGLRHLGLALPPWIFLFHCYWSQPDEKDFKELD